MKTPIPARIANMQVSAAEPKGAPKVIFAALDADIAREMEPAFAEAGCAVISNSSAFRMHPQVPLVIPEINRRPSPAHRARSPGAGTPAASWSPTPTARSWDSPWPWLPCRKLSASNPSLPSPCRPSAARAIPASPPWTSSATSFPTSRTKRKRWRKKPANSSASSREAKSSPPASSSAPTATASPSKTVTPSPSPSS